MSTPQQPLFLESVPDSLPLIMTIHNAPDDDAAKLVFADWLQEREHPEGEVLRFATSAIRAAGSIVRTNSAPATYFDDRQLSVREAYARCMRRRGGQFLKFWAALATLRWGRANVVGNASPMLWDHLTRSDQDVVNMSLLGSLDLISREWFAAILSIPVTDLWTRNGPKRLRDMDVRLAATRADLAWEVKVVDSFVWPRSLPLLPPLS